MGDEIAPPSSFKAEPLGHTTHVSAPPSMPCRRARARHDTPVAVVLGVSPERRPVGSRLSGSPFGS